MHSYGQVYLSEPTPDLVAWTESNVQPHELYEFPEQTWPGPKRALHPFQYLPQPRVRLNTLFWPVGASRWAVGHFCVSEAQLNAIRALASPSGSSVIPLPFLFSDGANSIATSLWMLPATPLATALVGAGFYIITLVDDRYFWWRLTVNLQINEGTTTWADLYTTIGGTLGVTINADPIPDAYLFPPNVLTEPYGHLPPLLDVVAASVGQRIVRQLDGTVQAQSAASALGLVQAQSFVNYPKYAGGPYALAP